MIRGWRTEFAVRERMANPHREAALSASSDRVGAWRVGLIRALLQHRPPWRDPAFLTQQGDPS